VRKIFEEYKDEITPILDELMQQRLPKNIGAEIVKVAEKTAEKVIESRINELKTYISSGLQQIQKNTDEKLEKLLKGIPTAVVETSSQETKEEKSDNPGRPKLLDTLIEQVIKKAIGGDDLNNMIQTLEKYRAIRNKLAIFDPEMPTPDLLYQMYGRGLAKGVELAKKGLRSGEETLSQRKQKPSKDTSKVSKIRVSEIYD